MHQQKKGFNGRRGSILHLVGTARRRGRDRHWGALGAAIEAQSSRNRAAIEPRSSRDRAAMGTTIGAAKESAVPAC
ncbi:hypothetical protein HUS70_09870 [Pandoraea nosoerga]|uniref:hypothetical protein n=1 Tax=Pandoraea nosoerga TaxID=2508296 RepID=UPI001242D913|nr:hypothetical protein [Pandoraea nosoerga]MBN4666922.1 hypothetical protein [Pandoraea nosoerga]MBN4677052.1 hypothetical protein [Pandoraea nosoerga]MBN4681722.1 hypothetical protein [Pandoraea nosoerga]MBN4744948.1 hypothetical protein [Pandoraea nosoerga]